MIETIEFKGETYPAFQATGNAARFCRAFANELCKGVGYDIGYCKEEWKFPGAIGIEPSIEPEYHATNLPDMKVDYIHSSHCLEHVPNWREALDHWETRLHYKGVLFLYLPHYSQKYWRSWFNFKHIHNLSPEILKDFLIDRGYINIFVSQQDLNNSFYVTAQKNK